MVPTSRIEFKELILSNLGKGIIRVEVTDNQVENWIDYAIKRAVDYHFDFSQEQFYKYQITDTDITNRWSGPGCVGGCAPRALEDSMRSRRKSGRGGRPLKLTVRRMAAFGAVP